MRFLTIATCAVLAATHAEGNTRGCLDPNYVDYDLDYFPDKISPTYSKKWDITYHNTYKILTNKFVDETYLLYQCGTEPPVSEDGKHKISIEVPLQDGVALTQTVDIPFLEQLNLRRQVKAYLGDPQYINSPCMQTLRDDPDGMTRLYDESTYCADPNDCGTFLDTFLADHENLLILQGTAKEGRFTMSGTVGEEKNLEIYEWYKMYATLFNMEKEGNEHFNDVAYRYECVSDNASVLAESRRLEEKPKVLWAYYADWAVAFGGDAYWDIARCDEKYNYYCEFADLCASELLHSNDGTIANPYQTGDYHMTSEEFFEYAKDADHWIYPSDNFDKTYSQFKDELDNLNSVKNAEVYDIQGSGAGTGAWFEHRFAEPDIILQDFCEVVGMYDDTSAPHSRAYFRKTLPNGGEDIVEEGTCAKEDIDQEWVTQATECVFITPKTPAPSASPKTPAPTASPENNGSSNISTASAALTAIVAYMFM